MIHVCIAYTKGVYCSDSHDDYNVYESCGDCNIRKKPNDTVSNSWCGGNCVFDEENKECIKGN